MIRVELHERNKHNSFKQAYYRDQLGRIVRKALIDDNSNIVSDYLYEYDADQRISCIVLYAQDHVTELAVKKYTYYEGSHRLKGTAEYRYQDKREILLQRAEHAYNDTDQTCKVTLYGALDEPVGYEVYGYRKGDDFMSLLGCYNMKNEKISYFDFELEKLF